MSSWTRWLRRPGLLGAALIGVGGAVAGTSLHGALHGLQVWTGAVIGAAVAVTAWVLAERFRLVVFEWVSVSLGLFLVLGGPVVGLVPTPAAYNDFFGGIAEGWADLLSTVPPTPADGPLAAPPYLLAWASTTIGLAVLRHIGRIRLPAIGMVGPVTGFAAGLLFIPELTRTSIAQAVALLALTLTVGRHQLTSFNLEPDRLLGNTTMVRRRSRLLQAGLIVVVVVVGAAVLAPYIPGPDDQQRLTLRDRLEPPWEPLDEPSPLAHIKSNYVDEVRDDVVFVVRGDAVPARWSVATLAAYDGTVWTVGDSELSGRAPFVSIDRLAPVDERSQRAGATSDTTAPVAEPMMIDVELVDLDGPWLPLAGRLLEIDLTAIDPTGLDPSGLDPSGSDPTDAIDMRFNARTGTAAAPGRPETLRYTALVRPWPVVPQDDLVDLDFPEPAALGLEGQAASVRDWSADVVEGLDRGWDQVAAIRDELIQGGYLADDKLQPGHSWARLNKFFADEEFYGNEEQYAAVAGIAARNAGLSARVVVGYVIDPAKLAAAAGGSDDEEVAVTRGEASAWLEVLTVQHGWVPVDITPPRDNEPTIEDKGTRFESVAAPNPPPPPPPPPEIEAETPDEELDDEEETDDDEATSTGRSWLVGLAVGVASAVGFPLVAVAAWLGMMVLLKGRRRRRRTAREPPDSVAGAWFELADRLDEAGVGRGRNFSLDEQAILIGGALGDGTESARLAHLVDRAAFSRDGVDHGDAAQAWSDCDALVERLQDSAPLPVRLRRLADPRALATKDPVA